MTSHNTANILGWLPSRPKNIRAPPRRSISVSRGGFWPFRRSTSVSRGWSSSIPWVSAA